MNTLNTCTICKKQFSSLRKTAQICSKECKRIKHKQYMQTYSNPKIFTKICDACNQPFKIKDKRVATCSTKCRYKKRAKVLLKKYGYENPSQKPRTEEEKKIISARKSIVMKKVAKTSNPKRIKTMLKKYGVSNLMSTPEAVKKRIETTRKRYGSPSMARVPLLKANNCKTYEEFCNKLARFIEKTGVPPHSDAVKKEFHCSSEPITTALAQINKLDLLHKCKSEAETELYKFLINDLKIKNIVKRNSRPSFMDGKELDLFIPDKNLAMEYHGLAIHSERITYHEQDPQLTKTQHETKYLRCRKEGITLIQIFEDEWRDKRLIIESMITNRLGITPTKIYARQCEAKEVKSLKEFFQTSHIAGNTNSNVKFGLFYEGELVAGLSLRTPFTNKPGTIEIARFSSKLNTQVVGGFQKLLKRAEAWAVKQGFTKILSYADCRFGTGEVYLKAGFTHMGKTKPNYFYEKDGIREGRFKHRKNNSEGFIEMYGSTEREQQNTLGWYALYDAGSEIYCKNIP